LLGQRQVETKVVPPRRLLFWARIGALQHDLDRITGKHVDHAEDGH